MTIKLHWANSSATLEEGRNFGDWLSPEICEVISKQKVVFAPPKECELVAIGSILQRMNKLFFQPSVQVWGTGHIEQIRPYRSKHQVHAVRGKLTANLLKNKSVTTFGDPGLLCHLLMTDRQLAQEKKYSVGFIPHYKDQQNTLIKNLANTLPQSTIIDVMQGPAKVIKHILSCQFIFSSSLHGLVVADSFSIPNQWVELSKKVRGKGFKFKDYYSIYDINEPKPFPVNEKLSMVDIERLKSQYHRNNIEEIKKNLLGSFPFPALVEV